VFGPRSGPTSPMFDAAMVGSEAVIHSPQDSLGPAADFDLAVDRPDVGLHRVGAEVGELVTSALLLP
jgi:hypothetical protein